MRETPKVSDDVDCGERKVAAFLSFLSSGSFFQEFI